MQQVLQLDITQLVQVGRCSLGAEGCRGSLHPEVAVPPE